MDPALRRIKTFLNIAIFLTLLILLALLNPYFLNREEIDVKSKYGLELVTEEQHNGPYTLTFTDLDNNGDDEYVYYGTETVSASGAVLKIYQEMGHLLRRRVFREKPVDYFTALDINQDNTKELLLPYRTPDSLKMRIMDFVGNPMYDFALGSIPPEDNVYVSIIGVIHTNKEQYLVYKLRTTKNSLDSEGIFAITFTGKIKWHIPFGKNQPKCFLSDLEGRSETRLICIVNSTRRDTEKTLKFHSEYKDSLAYLIVFDSGGHELRRREFAGRNISLEAVVADINPNDPGDEILLAVSRRSNLKRGKNLLFLFDQSLSQPPVQTYIERIRELNYLDFNDDSQKEIALSFFNGKLLLLDTRFNKIGEKELGDRLQTGIDLSSRLLFKNKRYLVQYTRRIWLRIRDKNLNVILSRPMGGKIYFYRDRYDGPEFICIHKEWRNLQFFRFKYNYFFFLFRFSYIFIGLLIGLTVARIVLFFLPSEGHTQVERLIRLAINKDFDFGIAVFDNRRRMVTANSKLNQIFHRDFKSFFGKRYDDILSILNPPLKRLLDDIYEGDFYDIVREIPHRYEGKEREIKVILHKIDRSYDPYLTTSFVLLIADDITELIQSKRLGAWLSLAQRYAHDVKTPLSTVHLTIQRIEMELEKDNIERKGRYLHYLNYMKEEVTRIRNVTNGFLKFVRAEKLIKSPVDFNGLIKRMADRYEQRLPEGITLKLKLGESVNSVQLDEEQFQTVLENLLDNAINAIAEQGEITITTDIIEEVKEDDSSIHRLLLVEIADTGCGIPEENLHEVFQPYYSNSVDGTGLGLVFARRIIEEHGGAVYIRSQKDIGTVVIIKLPA